MQPQAGHASMSNESILVTLLIGGLVGWLAGLLMRGAGYGIIGNIVVGLLGAFIGSWLFSALKLSLALGNPLVERVLIALIGALLLMFIVSLLRPLTLRERVGGFWRRR